jgi:hypothetical protein
LFLAYWIPNNLDELKAESARLYQNSILLTPNNQSHCTASR